MANIHYREIEGSSTGWWGLMALFGALMLAGLGSSWYMEHHGHVVTGMNNQIVWGMPHVFAVFLIVAASGALNVASIASVFGKKFYKPLAPLSGLLAMCLLTGGLVVLVLDLGRPDRLIVAMTHYNFKSIFAWNIILYNGFLGIVAAYLWTMMDVRMGGYSKLAGVTAFIWRLILTTGTGSIFGFLVARQAYDAALLAPMFIIMSFAYGLAIFVLVLMGSYRWTARPLGDAVLDRLRGLLATFVSAVLYFVLVYHLTNLYITEDHGVEAFILLGRNGGETYSLMFWLGWVVMGGLLPLALLLAPALKASRPALVAASVLVIIGGLAAMYVVIIGGQAYPLQIFPGMEVLSSGFQDGQPAPYTPTLPEILLGLGGMAMALAAVTFALKVLRFLPESLDDAVVHPHHKA
jgi:molybdopterin-containing oxidoreductase family membrane subunit